MCMCVSCELCACVCRHTCVFSHQVTIKRLASAPLAPASCLPSSPGPPAQVCTTASKVTLNTAGPGRAGCGHGPRCPASTATLEKWPGSHGTPQAAWAQPRSHQGQPTLRFKPLGSFLANTGVMLEERQFSLRSEVETEVSGRGACGMSSSQKNTFQGP